MRNRREAFMSEMKDWTFSRWPASQARSRATISSTVMPRVAPTSTLVFASPPWRYGGVRERPSPGHGRSARGHGSQPPQQISDRAAGADATEDEPFRDDILLADRTAIGSADEGVDIGSELETGEQKALTGSDSGGQV